MTLDAYRRELLAARDERAETIARLCAGLWHVPEGVRGSPIAPRCLVFLSLNAPGAQKNDPRLDPLFARARAALLAESPDGHVAADGRDALGAWAAIIASTEPRDAKRRCVALEEETPGGRLVDLDVFDAAGTQLSRQSLGLPPRRCLVCAEAAVDCMRLQRHAAAEVQAAVGRLLA